MGSNQAVFPWSPTLVSPFFFGIGFRESRIKNQDSKSQRVKESKSRKKSKNHKVKESRNRITRVAKLRCLGSLAGIMIVIGIVIVIVIAIAIVIVIELVTVIMIIIIIMIMIIPASDPKQRSFATLAM